MLFPLFGYYEQCCYEYLCISFCEDVCFHFSWLLPRSLTTESYGKSMFNLSRNCQIVLSSSHTILHSQKQLSEALVSLHPCQYLLLFKITAILMDVKCYLNMIFICTFLTANDVEHPIMYSFTILVSSLEIYLLKYLPTFNKVAFY